MRFDGVEAPEVIVEVAFGNTATQDLAAQGTFILNDSLLNGTDTLGSFSWIPVIDDLVSLDISTGQDDDTSGARNGTATVVLENWSGAYDPSAAELVNPDIGVFPSTTLYPGTGQFPDGGLFPDIVGAQQVDVGKPIRISYRYGTTVYPRFYGYVDDITFDAGFQPTVSFACVDGLEDLGRAPLAALSTPQFVGDASDVRVGRILDLAGWATSQRILEPGLLTLATTTFGDYALPLLQEVADSELGKIFVDANGNFVFYNRLHIYTATRSTTVQATLSDSGTDVDMLELTVQKSRSRVYNTASVTRNGGTEQTATDAASVAAYRARQYPGQVGTLAPTDPDALSLASWLISRYAQPHVEVRQVQVDATAQGMWATLLPLVLLDRIRVIRDYGPNTIDRQLLILGIQEQVTPESWTMAFNTMNTLDFTPFVLDSSLLDSTAEIA